MDFYSPPDRVRRQNDKKDGKNEIYDKMAEAHAVAMQRNAPKDAGIMEGNVQRNGNHPTTHKIGNRKWKKETPRKSNHSRKQKKRNVQAKRKEKEKKKRTKKMRGRAEF